MAARWASCRIRQEHGAKPIVVVALTGWGQSQDKQRAIEAGFDAHLTKPVDPAVFEELLAGSRADSPYRVPFTNTGAVRYRSGNTRFRSPIFGRSL